MIFTAVSEIITKAFRRNFILKGLTSAARSSSSHPSHEYPENSGSENLFYIVPDPDLVIKRSKYLRSIAGKTFQAKPEIYKNLPFELTEWNYFLVESRKAVIVLEPSIHTQLLSLRPEKKMEVNRTQQAIALFEEGRNPKNPFVIIKTYKIREKMWHWHGENYRFYFAVLNLCREIQKTTPHVLFMTGSEDIQQLGLFNKIKSQSDKLFKEGWVQKEDC